MAQLYAAPADGDVVSLSVYVGGGSGIMRMALYADQGGEPGALLGASADQAVSSTADGH